MYRYTSISAFYTYVIVWLTHKCECILSNLAVIGDSDRYVYKRERRPQLVSDDIDNLEYLCGEQQIRIAQRIGFAHAQKVQKCPVQLPQFFLPNHSLPWLRRPHGP